jgi:general stress protein YciG
MAKKKGFAALSAERLQEVTSRGGKAAHASGNAHEFTEEEARQAGKKGGAKISRNREHMAAIGRKGGRSAHASGNAHEFTSEEARQARQQGLRRRKRRPPPPS